MLQRMDLLIYISNTLKAFDEQLEDLKVEKAIVENTLKKNPKTGREFKSVERTLQVNEKLYLFMLEKRANTYIAKSGIIPRTKVIEKARVIATVGGDYLKKGIYFAVIGFILELF